MQGHDSAQAVASPCAAPHPFDWPPTRLSKHLRLSLRWTDRQMQDAIAAGRVRLLESGCLATDLDAFVFPPPLPPVGTAAALTLTRADSAAVAVDGVRVLPWDSRYDAHVFALHKPRGMEIMTTPTLRKPSRPRAHADFCAWLKLLTATLPPHGSSDNSVRWSPSEVPSSTTLPPPSLATSLAPVVVLGSPGRRALFHIGRLDKPTSGLIFVTNDGDLGCAVCEPGVVRKEYVATVRRCVKHLTTCVRAWCLHLCVSATPPTVWCVYVCACVCVRVCACV
jgi:hypothetical protein